MPQEPKVILYDPSVDAYREFPISVAKKFIESAKEAEAKIAEIEAEG